MFNYHKISLVAVLATIFLLPLFFIPGGAIDSLNAKAFLIVIGASFAGLLVLWQVFKEGKIVLPKHYLIIAAAFLPLVYLLSALLATPSSLSLLGYNLEVGTFGSIFIGFILLGVSAVVFSEPTRSLQVVVVLFSALSLLALFAAIKVLSGGNWLVWGNFFGNMGNPLGAWTDLAMAMGLLAVLGVLAVGMLPVRGALRALIYSVTALSTILLVVIHFRSAFFVTLLASILLGLFFYKIENNKQAGSKAQSTKSKFSSGLWLSSALAVICLIFIVNPIVSAQKGTIGTVISSSFKVSNSEVHPALSATLNISKSVLSQNVLLGSGPNTFTQDWLVYKPADINATPFWSVAFPFGAGFVATQISATGIVGSLAWLVFFALLLSLMLKIITEIPESKAVRFALVSTLAVAAFLWVACFVYMPSSAVLAITFTFTGLLLALAGSTGVIPSLGMHFKDSASKFFTNIVVVALALSLASIAWFEIEKVVGAYHFELANRLANINGSQVSDVEAELNKAINYAPLDTYFLALSNLSFSKAQVIASSATGTSEQVQSAFQTAISQSLNAARSAVDSNPAGYNNWSSLGSIYSALVAKPLVVDGAYDNAQFAFNEAFKRNPNNPSLPLQLAQLEINKEDYDKARAYIRNAISLKDDYADAYLLLARLEASQNNLSVAIASAEKLATLTPDNAGVHFEIGVLKYTAENYTGAVASLEKALSITPDYANAKYYLALADIKLGNIVDAKALLEELSTTNPESAEVKDALDSLNQPAKPKK